MTNVFATPPMYSSRGERQGSSYGVPPAMGMHPFPMMRPPMPGAPSLPPPPGVLTAPPGWRRQNEVTMPPMLMSRIDSVINKIEFELGSPRPHAIKGSQHASPRQDPETSSARGAETMLATAGAMDRDIRRIEACKRMQIDLKGLQQNWDPRAFDGNGMEDDRMKLRQLSSMLEDKMEKLEDLHHAMQSRGRLPASEEFTSPEFSAVLERERLLRGELAEAEAFSAATLRQKALLEQEKAKQSRIDTAQIEDLKNQLSNARIVVAKQEAKIRQGEADLLRIADLERQVWMLRHSKTMPPPPAGEYDLQERVAELENALESTHAAERRQGEALADAVYQLHMQDASRVAAERILAEEHGTTIKNVDSVVQAMAAKQINHPQNHSSRRRANSSSVARTKASIDLVPESIHPLRHSVHYDHDIVGNSQGSRNHSPLTSTFERGSHPLRSPSSAEDLNRRVMEECEAKYGPDHPDTLLYASRLADSLQDMGRYDEANVPYQRALGGRRRVLGADDLSTMETMTNFANNLKKQGRMHDAESLFRQALQGREARLGRSHSDTLLSVWNLGQLLKEEGRFDEAEELFQRELQGHQERLGADHEQTRRRDEHLKLFREQHGRQNVPNTHSSQEQHSQRLSNATYGHHSNQEHRPSASSHSSKLRSAPRRSVGSDLGFVGDSDGSGAEDDAMRELAQHASIHSHYSPDDLHQHLQHPSASSPHTRNSVHSHHSHHSLRKSIEHPGGRSSFQGQSDPHVHAQESYPLPPSSLPQVAPKTSAATKKKGVSALLKGLRSGEVSKIVDNMDAANIVQNNQVAGRHSVHSHHSFHSHHSQHHLPSNDSLHTSPHRHSHHSVHSHNSQHQLPSNDSLHTNTYRHSLSSDGLHLGHDPTESFIDSGLHVPPPDSSPLPQASVATKKKGAAALLKGLRSGEVSKLVDNMELANDIEPSPQAHLNNHSLTGPEQMGTSHLGSPRHQMVHQSPRGTHHARTSEPVHSNVVLGPPQARRSLQYSNLGQDSLRQSSPLDTQFLNGPHDTFLIGPQDNHRNSAVGHERRSQIPTETTVYEDLTMNMSSDDSHDGPHVLG